MSRGDGFAIADVDVGFYQDTAIKRVARTHPDLFPVAVAGYIGILLASWQQGRRVCAVDGWPEILPYSQAAIDALKEPGVELLDADEMPKCGGLGAMVRGGKHPSKARPRQVGEVECKARRESEAGICRV